MDAPTDTFVFHVDATLKLSTLGYPVLVCGVSDQNRRFHLVALFIMSQRTEAVYQEALQALRTTFSVVVGKAIAIRYVMGDAEHARYAAHLIANVQEHLRGVSNESCIEVLRAIYAMHYASSVDEFYAIVQESFHSWSCRPDLLGFAQYFNNQWLPGRFRVWQCFARPAGNATTNNPVKQFNNVLKRDYSLCARLKLGTLVKLIASCVRAISVDTTLLATTSTIPLAIRTRMKILVRANKLVMKPPRLSINFLLTDTSTQSPSNTEPGVVFVFSCRGSAGIKTGNSTSISYLNAEMESIGQPTWGWKVNLLTKACEWKYFMKYRSCVHLCFAINSAAEDERDSEEFVNSNPRRQCGRPPTVGPALSYA
ncbi:TPA: hypothetical protein N0F65_000662 [Lagenidium giganteum]|uniref:MULE transposase domain-containing protein n=1 Tax=Lagenidium giganteum TaxID=4803 RepID=A0AAV2YRW3_9STRA|nr:TPA: hypothetical protein N0F65_000662 [Lagenidium giganteum]